MKTMGQIFFTSGYLVLWHGQGRTDHLETRALPEGPGCPWYLFHRLF
ncbi:unnamed protein product [Staurois parvus]|uniref:Uncharacterized protein n=1 Tax=Staurois parvus TaxID=386267 RepID=A0ABN9G1M6_9NEOB|nr:unnamed protein product [Staurois parvus]